MKRAVVIGTGSFGQLADLYLRVDGGYEIPAFVVTDDHVKKMAANFSDRPVVGLGRLRELFDPGNTEVFVAVGYRGMNSVRRDLCHAVKSAGFRLLSYAHSSVTCWQDTKIGENVFIFEDNTIQPFTSIGDGVVMWSGNHLGHHSVIEDWTFIPLCGMMWSTTSAAVTLGGFMSWHITHNGCACRNLARAFCHA